MELSWTTKAWEHYLYWQETDKAVLRKLNDLLQECLRTPRTGKGKPEALKGDLRGCWSRRITEEHRLVYEIKSERILVLYRRFHYEK